MHGGNHGYSDKQAYEAVIDVLSEISDREEAENIDIIEATVIAYLNPKPMKRVVEDCREVSYKRCVQSNAEILAWYEKHCELDAASDEKVLKEIKDEHSFYNVVRFMSDINPGDMFYPKFMPGKTAYTRPYDFVDDYCTQKKLPVKTLREYDSHKRQKVRNNQTLSKIDVFRFSVLLNLTKTEILQFMALCGWASIQQAVLICSLWTTSTASMAYSANSANFMSLTCGSTRRTTSANLPSADVGKTALANDKRPYWLL